MLRRLLTRGLEITAGDEAVRRGGEVEATVTIASPGKLGNVEVGLVCTEYYDKEETTRDEHGSMSTSRETRNEIVHEAWSPVESFSRVQSVRFPIPADAPFSFTGECLSFRWEVVARGKRSGRLDAEARAEFSVQP
jgi:hypothetical protein